MARTKKDTLDGLGRSVADEAFEIIDRWRNHPDAFIEEAIFKPRGKNERLSTQQKNACEEISKLVRAKINKSLGLELSENEAKYADKIGLSVQSGKGCGKDMLVACLELWFLTVFDEAFIPNVAPTAHQLEDIIWREAAIWLAGSAVETIIKHQATKIFHVEGLGKTRYAFPITANPKSDPQTQVKTMSGLHSKHMMIVIDEADGLPDPVFKELESTMTSPINFAIVIFNPTKNTGFAIETQKSGKWVCLHWDAVDSENVTRESIQAAIEKYGENSNYVRVYIHGLPPMAEPDALIPWDWVYDAIDRDIEASEEFDGLIFGVDVGGGGDASIICPKRGGRVYPLLRNMSPDSTKVGEWVSLEMGRQDAEASFVDVIGIGNGAVGELRRQGKRVYAVDVRRTPHNTARFHKLRDELWWKVRDAFQEGTISIPHDAELLADLTTLKFTDENGKVKVEGKGELRQRGKPSPNKGDALMHTFYMSHEVFNHRADHKYGGTKYYHGAYSERSTTWMGA